MTDLLLGRYRVLAVLGRGAYGTVYQARDTELDRLVAVKVLRPAVGQRADRKRFEREAQLTARFRHPHVVSVFDAGRTPAGEAFIVYEFVGGRDLRRLPRPVDPRQACTWIGEIAGALQALHHQGILHRDVKPANILIRDDDGRAVLCDLGLAVEQDLSTRFTRPGFVVGTPAYAAPEIWRGAPHSPATEQFALAASLFDLVYEARVVPVEDQAALVEWLSEEGAVEVPRDRAGEHPELERVLARACGRAPESRFPSLGAFAHALAVLPWGARSSDAWSRPSGVGSGARPARGGSLGRVALVILGALVFAGLRPSPVAPPPAASPRPLEGAGELAAARVAAEDRLARLVRAPREVLLDPRFELQWRGLLEALGAYLSTAGVARDPARAEVLRGVVGETRDLLARLGTLRALAGDPAALLRQVPEGATPGEYLKRVERWVDGLRGAAADFLVGLEARGPTQDPESLELEVGLVLHLVPARVGATLRRLQEAYAGSRDGAGRGSLLGLEERLLRHHPGPGEFPCAARRVALAAASSRLQDASTLADEALRVRARGLALGWCWTVLVACPGDLGEPVADFRTLVARLNEDIGVASRPTREALAALLEDISRGAQHRYRAQRDRRRGELAQVAALLEDLESRRAPSGR